MKRSSDGILTTHIGSLPRPRDLWAMIDAKDRGRPYDQGVLAQRLKSAVADIVKKQAEVGIDIPSDGEQSKSSFSCPGLRASTRSRMPVRLRHFRSTRNGRGAVALTLALYWGPSHSIQGPWDGRTGLKSRQTSLILGRRFRD